MVFPSTALSICPIGKENSHKIVSHFHIVCHNDILLVRYHKGTVQLQRHHRGHSIVFCTTEGPTYRALYPDLSGEVPFRAP